MINSDDIEAVKEFLGEEAFNNMEQLVNRNIGKMPAYQQQALATQLKEIYYQLEQLMEEPDQKNAPANKGKGSEEETESSE